jgi:hypothetical protein
MLGDAEAALISLQLVQTMEQLRRPIRPSGVVAAERPLCITTRATKPMPKQRWPCQR